KNLIFDTTLSNGEWSANLIKDLQARGYDVEVRAMAAHKLESEHGVDERFSTSLDRRGYGRYVPAGAREAIYTKLPISLDTVHAQTSAPIRIF
ncbi:zeta toxin family protein, partial [Xanthomonas fragariae]|uniref:zeta toxin family protein n=1 Tax=Xanthomonas fragariae TaxID=48664 RepID=UPI0035307688